MGKRGPKPGTTYKTRPVAVQPVRVTSDKQLVAAQHFNERVDRLLREIDGHQYPASHIDSNQIHHLVQTLEAVQTAVIAGIAEYILEEERRRRPRSRPKAAISGASTFATASRRPPESA